MKVILLFLMPLSLWAQSFFEASGQTYAFTLAGGNKTGWNYTAAVERKVGITNDLVMTLSPNPVINYMKISLNRSQVNASVAVFNIGGKKIQNIDMNNQRDILLTRTFASGIYFARLQVGGKLVQTTRFLVVR